MSDPRREQCYGGMFPDALRFVVNRPSAGKVFGFEVESAGWGSRSGRSIQVDGEAWRHCLECPDFDDCYKLSIAKMALSAAIASQ